MDKLVLGNGKDSLHITIDFVGGDVIIESGTVSIAQWQTLVNRTNTALMQEGLIERPKQLHPRSHGSPVKKAPWFLRPWYQKVMPKERRDY